MKKELANGQPRNFEYPDNSKGAGIAKKARSESSTLSEESRDELFKTGMQVIYGSNGGDKKVGRR